MCLGQIQEIVNAIHQKGSFAPEYGIILGSGLGGLADELESPIFVNYNDLPGFPVSTAPGHMGRFVFGTLAGHRVVCMQGRLHYYEGHPMSSLALPVRVMQQLGIRALIVTNACGGVNLDFEVGDLMLIEDHINFMGTNPLIGPNADEFGPRFFDMSTVYNKTLREVARKAAASLSVPLRQGIYLGYTGPNYETPAEIRAFRTLGADAVGMSTVPEVLAAAHCGLPVLAISLITNMAAGITEKRLDGDHVIEIANSRALVLRSLVKQIVADIPAQLI
ncbi:purine-nucleoside phosphorylase [Pygmaiobacter massiliensis]|uniref:purine-nucleoside phosphorylase n=1 Tax=Pygmaiobacter massiliensis TaxID=1917873 RepID=UPI0035E3E9AB